MSSSQCPGYNARADHRRVLSSLAGSPKFGTIRGIKFRTLVSRIGPGVSSLGLTTFLSKSKKFMFLSHIWVVRRTRHAKLARTCNIKSTRRKKTKAAGSRRLSMTTMNWNYFFSITNEKLSAMQMRFRPTNESHFESEKFSFERPRESPGKPAPVRVKNIERPEFVTR